jgi:uncharacterized protein
MRRPFTKVLLLIGMLFLAQPAAAQPTAPPPEDALQAARELVKIMDVGAQFRAILPTLMQALRPAIVQNRPEVGRDFDALVPMMVDTMLARTNEFSEIYAVIYARNFTAQELRDVAAFYRTETGQKLLAKLPVVTNEGMMAGQRLGQQMAVDLQQRMVDELRKKGHNI